VGLLLEGLNNYNGGKINDSYTMSSKKKRGNENGQMSKEDYERVSSVRKVDGGQFQRVGADVLKSRRIIKTRRQERRSPSGTTTVTSPNEPGKENDDKPKNPFASVSLVKAGESNSKKPTFSFGNFASSKPTSAPVTTTQFSFGNSTTTTTTATAVTNPSDTLRSKYQKRADNMYCSFHAKLGEHGPASVWLPLLDQYMDSVVKMKFAYFTEVRDMKNSKPTTAPSFSFGSTTSSSNITSPASTNGVGSNTTTTNNSNTMGSFGGFASSSSYSSIQNTGNPFGATSTLKKPSPATDSKDCETSASDAPPAAAASSTEDQLARGDSDWDDIGLLENIHIFHNRGGKPNKFASGLCRLQKRKDNADMRRMINRDVAGKVRLNVQIYKGMKFQRSVYKKKNGVHVERALFMGIMDKDTGKEMFEFRRAQVAGSSLEDILTKAAAF